MKLSFLGLIVAAMGVASCGDSSDNGGGSQTGLDGVWDITSYDTGGPAEMTVVGGTVTGYIANGSEGKPNFRGKPDCTATKNRTEFTITASGDAITMTRTAILQATGSSCDEYDRDYKRTVSFSGVRTRSAPPSSTDLNGEWTVTGEGDSWAATVNGYTVSAKSNTGPKRPKPEDEDTITISVAGGVITLGSSDDSLKFAARQRR